MILPRLWLSGASVERRTSLELAVADASCPSCGRENPRIFHHVRNAPVHSVLQMNTARMARASFQNGIFSWACAFGAASSRIRSLTNPCINMARTTRRPKAIRLRSAGSTRNSLWT